MNCKKCNFYCYDDEYICPNCESLLERELPIDEYERSLFIYNKMLERRKTGRIMEKYSLISNYTVAQYKPKKANATKKK